jgi:hypothetical protein
MTQQSICFHADFRDKSIILYKAMDGIIIGPCFDLSLLGFRRVRHPQSVQERLQTVIDVPSFTQQFSRRLLSK